MADYYSIQEFAKLKKCSRQTIYNAIKRNQVEVAELYGKTLVRKTKKNNDWQPVDSKKR